MAKLPGPINNKYQKLYSLRDVLVVAGLNCIIFITLQYLTALFIVNVIGYSPEGFGGLTLGLVVMPPIIVATVSIVSIIAKRRGLPRPVLTVLLASALTYTANSFFAGLLDSSFNGLFNRIAFVPSTLVLLGISVASFLLVLRLLSLRWQARLRTKIVVIVLSIVLIGAGGSLLAAYIFETKERNTYNHAVENLGFVVYRPTYVPSPLEDKESVPKIVRPLAATEYYATDVFHSSSQPYGGLRVAILQNKLKPGFRVALDPPNVCDAGAVKSAIKLDESTIDVSTITTNLCKLYATTPKGYKIYGSNSFNTRSDNGKKQYNQSTAFYVQLNDTVTIWDFDDAIGSTYADEFLPDFTKMVDSLEEVEPNQLKK